MTTNARYLKDYTVPEFLIDTVSLEFELDDNNTIVTNLMQIRRNGQHSKPLILDGEHLQLVSVSINNQTLPESNYEISDNQLTIADVPDSFSLQVITKINPAQNTALEGLYKSGGAFCTQCEAEGFRRISYFLDRPDIMAVYSTKIIADKNKYPHLLANGNKISSGESDNGRHFVQWHDPHKKPCYLFALVAGDFDLLSDSYRTFEGRDVALEIYVDKGNLAKAQHAMSSLIKSMQWDEQTFGLAYDLDIYMIVAVDFFNMGAMENKGLNIFNSKYVLADTQTATDTDYFNIESVIAHEYFHNWTGNRVTCRDWFQLSLKEGLTVFRDQQFSADMHSAAVTRIQNVRKLRTHQFPEDAGPMAHPIRPEKVKEMNNFYTMTVYEKGSEVIRMMHTLLGKEHFRQGMDLYFKRHDGQAVTCDDFVNAMQDASGIDLSLFRRWYSQSGTPLLTVTSNYDSVEQRLTVTLKQTHSETLDKQQKYDLHIPVAIEIIDPKLQKTTSHLLELTQSENSWQYDNVDSKCVVAVLSAFSAPVKLDFEQSDQQLQAIIAFADDLFLKWDATQALFSRYLISHARGEIMQYPDSLKSLIENRLTQETDLAFLAEQLKLPDIDTLLMASPGLCIDRLHSALIAFKTFIGAALSMQLLQAYQTCQSSDDDVSSEAAAKRALRNVCLSYLATQEPQQHLINSQFEQSQNMTLQLAALTNAAINNLASFPVLMKSFAQNWYDNTLVMDKWFTINAMLNSENVIEHVTELLVHPLFTLENPNRARSLLGAFATNNAKGFHCLSGQGYRLLADQIIKLDKINPQVASRLITPLIQFQSLDVQRQNLIKQQLKRIQAEQTLSKDLEEKLSAAIG